MRITTNVVISGICSFVFLFLIIAVQEATSIITEVSVGEGECCDSVKCKEICYPLYLLYRYPYYEDESNNTTSQCFLRVQRLRSKDNLERISQKYINTTDFILIDTLHDVCLESFIYPIWIVTIFTLFFLGPIFNLYLFIKAFCLSYTSDDFQL